MSPTLETIMSSSSRLDERSSGNVDVGRREVKHVPHGSINTHRRHFQPKSGGYS